MDKIATENLFLLEFLVDRVELSQKCQCDAPPGETCVSFQFLDNAPLDVCEADFAPKRNYRDDSDSSTKSGKSCLFSLSPDQADICLDTFDIIVTIWKKMLPGWLPEKVEIGQAVISIANLFSELINTIEASDGSVPIAKTLKDDFDITNDRGENQGKITVYIRMSCFGKLIITQFQMNLDEKSVLFKDKEGKSLYRYKKAGKEIIGNSFRQRKDPVAITFFLDREDLLILQGRMDISQHTESCSGAGGQGGCTMRGPQGGYGGGMGYPQSPYGPGAMQAQYGGGGGGGMGYNSGCPTSPCGSDPMQGGGGMGYNSGCPTSPCGGDPMQGDPYGMGGNPYGMGGGSSYGAGPPGNGYGGGMPGNGSFGGNMGDNGSAGRGAYGQMPVPCMECGALPSPPCLPGTGSIGGSAVGGGADMMTPCQECGGLPSPPCIGGGGATAALTPCQECGGMPNPPCGAGTCGGATPCAECAGNPDAPCLNMGPCDYCPEPPEGDGDMANKEVFVLKIGKKKEGTDKKPRMELELVTPKAAVVKPIPKLETRESQYDSKDINGKGGKGKNGKGKKKK